MEWVVISVWKETAVGVIVDSCIIYERVRRSGVGGGSREIWSGARDGPGQGRRVEQKDNDRPECSADPVGLAGLRGFLENPPFVDFGRDNHGAGLDSSPPGERHPVQAPKRLKQQTRGHP